MEATVFSVLYRISHTIVDYKRLDDNAHKAG